MRSFLLFVFLALPQVGQAQAPAYSAPQLNGARFRQTIRSQIRVETGASVTQERSGRDAIMAFQAAASDSGIEITGWFDSLAIWREAGGQRYAPETDGLVGGRYRGLLSPQGAYTWTDQPFIPDPIAELAEMGSAFDDVLPPMAKQALRPGQWAALVGGWRVERRADSIAGSDTLRRYAVSGERRKTAYGAEIDSMPVQAMTLERESGDLVWDPRRGPVRWRREITMSATLPAKGAIRRAVRTQIDQTILLERLADTTAAP